MIAAVLTHSIYMPKNTRKKETACRQAPCVALGRRENSKSAQARQAWLGWATNSVKKTNFGMAEPDKFKITVSD